MSVQLIVKLQPHLATGAISGEVEGADEAVERNRSGLKLHIHTYGAVTAYGDLIVNKRAQTPHSVAIVIVPMLIRCEPKRINKACKDGHTFEIIAKGA